MSEAELVPFYCSRCKAVICSADPSQLHTALLHHEFWRLADGSPPRATDVIEFTCSCGYHKLGLPTPAEFRNAVSGVKVHL